jgi:FkbM family methyltransferase
LLLSEHFCLNGLIDFRIGRRRSASFTATAMNHVRALLQSYVRPSYGQLRRWILSRLERRAPRDTPTTLEQIRTVSIDGIPHPIKLRAATSDARAMADCLLGMQYDIDPGFEPKTVLDLGGNIGCSAIYFANRWPNARIVVVEPLPSTFELLKENTRFYSNIRSVHAAAHPRRETISLHVPKTGFWGARVTTVARNGAAQSHSAPGVPVEDLMSEYGIDHIDILKMDIEGSEADLFANNPHPWLSRTRLVMIELHDNIRMGCTWHMERALSRYKTRRARLDENHIVWLESARIR